jgi:hypothetical protein
MALPTAQALTDAMEVAGSSPEAAKYLRDQLGELFVKSKKNKEGAGLMDQLDKFVESVVSQYASNTQAWEGIKGERSPLTNMYAQIAEQAASVLTGHEKELESIATYTMNFAINKNSGFIRGYSKEDKVEPTLGATNVQ